MKYYLYILLCDQKTYYVGITNNLDRRLAEHKNKKSFYTKQFSDISLVYTEEFLNKIEAEMREKQLKGWSIAKKIALINNDKANLIKLSKGTGPVGAL